MNTTLDVLDRALRGDPNALSFLERTASIYVLDTTDPSHPKTYGCWDFLNQALNEVERYETQFGFCSNHPGHEPPHLLGQEGPGPTSLSPHVQLLTSLSRRAARRPAPSDRSLIATCLSNAGASGAYVTSAESNQHLIDLNCQTRERVLGRIAALAFDFAFHGTGTSSSSGQSAFADPVSMEGLCTIVAANSVSSGPSGLRHLVADWIVPASSADHLPPLSAAAVCAHLADEAMSRGAPAGTSGTITELFEPVLSGVVGPLLAEAVRDSDASNGSGIGQSTAVPTRNQRVAAMALRALERWCAATGAGICRVKKVCAGGTSKVNIIDVISDALYSDSEAVIDSAAELLDTLLRRNEEDFAKLESVSLVNSFLGGSGAGIAATAESMKREAEERNAILAELVSAIGLQRFRFASATQSEGDSDVCRCLTRIASSITIASQSALRSGELGSSANGLMDLLLKAAAHSSVHVCGICLEAIPALMVPGSEFSDRLLPILQQRAIVPASLRGNHSLGGVVDCGVDFHEYSSFRENLLSSALEACYKNNRIFYMESCASAIEEFCSAATTPQLPYQLEAALFCLSAVAMDASKRALLMNSSPATQAAAARAAKTLKGQAETTDIALDAKRHDEELARCTAAIAKNPTCVTSNPLTLAQTCIFIGKYAKWYSKTPSQGSIDAAAEIALKSFNLTTSSALSKDASAQELIYEMTVSPVAESATALRNILSRSPAKFATPQALAALETGWSSSYASANTDAESIKIEDREALCSGLCRVLAALPSDQWTSSLGALAQTTIASLEAVTKRADEILGADAAKQSSETILSRMADEIRLLNVMTRTFRNAAIKRDKDSNGQRDQDDPSIPLIAVLRKAWPCLSQVTHKYSSYEIISTALGDFLTGAVVIQEPASQETSFFRDICEMAANVMAAVHRGDKGSSHASMLYFVQEAIDVYGQLGEADACSSPSTSPPPPVPDKGIRQILDRLLIMSFEAVKAAAGDIWSQVLEQEQGEKPRETSTPELKPAQEVKSPEELAAVFSLLTTCLQRCPVLLVKLSGSSETDQEEDALFLHAVEAATLTLNEKEVDVSRSSMIFLRTLIEINSEDTPSAAQRHAIIGTVVDDAIARVRKGITLSLVAGACGIYSREVLDPAAALLHALLKTSAPDEAEAVAVAALEQDLFRLGEDARRVTLVVLGKCAQGEKLPSTLMDLFGDVWQLHQSDDTNAIAGGDAVVKFIQKYGN